LWSKIFATYSCMDCATFCPPIWMILLNTLTIKLKESSFILFNGCLSHCRRWNGKSLCFSHSIEEKFFYSCTWKNKTCIWFFLTLVCRASVGYSLIFIKKFFNPYTKISPWCHSNFNKYHTNKLCNSFLICKWYYDILNWYFGNWVP
jgi:hypothetical protein